MNDLIELKLVTEDEAECLHRLQVEGILFYGGKRQYRKYMESRIRIAGI